MPWGNPTAPVPAWNVEDPNYVPQLDNADWLAERDRVLKVWDDAKTELEKAKATEMETRKAAQAFAFGPNAKEGMNNQELNNGFTLKFGKKMNYNLKATNTEIETTEDEAAKLGNRGSFLFERIITWTPNFSKSEYNKLDAEDPTDVAVKKLIDGILEIKEATGSLEIKAPKPTL